MSSMKRVKLSPDTPNSPDDAIEVGRDHDLDEFSRSKSKNHTPPDSLQINQQDPDVRQKEIMKVLKRVFDFCSTESLRNCRLVSTQWRDESLKAWRNKAILECTTDPSLDFKFMFTDYLQLVGSDKTENDDKEDDDDDVMFRSLKKHPFKHLSLWLDYYYEDWKKISSEMLRPISDTTRHLDFFVAPTLEFDVVKWKKFLSNFHSLESIYIQLSFQDWDRDYEKEEGLVDFTLPTVKRLEISRVTNRILYESLWGWEYVLKCFPNLEALFIEYQDVKESECLNNLKLILGYVKSIRESGGENVLALKELELRTEPNTKNVKLSQKAMEIIRLILACNFPLERLYITLKWEMIYELLESYKDTLQYLKASFELDLSFAVYKQHFEKKKNYTSICMAKLKEVSIGNGFLPAMDFLTLLELPLIEKMTIQEIKCYNKGAIFYPPPILPEGRVYERLETLEILDNHTMLLPSMILTFAKMMPNLTHLTIPLDKEMFVIVCDKFRGLRTLNILSVQWPHPCCDELDDESITGISNEVEDGAQRQPNITDLALLTDLQISSDRQLLEDRVALTHHSVIHGFLYLPRLYSLSIAFYDLSEEIRAKLVDHVKGDLCIQDKPNDDAEVGDKSETSSDKDEDSSDDESDSSDDESDPRDDEGCPRDDEGCPRDDEGGPSVDESDSSDDESDPSDDESDPSDDEGCPKDDEGDPSVDESDPRDDEGGPSVESDPSDDESGPSDDESYPSDDESDPSDDEGDPSVDAY